MPRPSQLSIDTSSVLRLLKEEKSYRIELKQQEARLEVLEGRGKEDGIGDPNYDFQVKQERKALDQTKSIIPSVKERTHAAVEKLQRQIKEYQSVVDANHTNADEVTKAEAALKEAREALAE